MIAARPSTGASSLIEELTRAAGAAKTIRAFVSALCSSKKALYEAFRERLDETSAKAVTLKLLNACLARFHFEARSAAVLSKPFGLVIDPINNCNLACPGCVHSTRSVGERLFDWNSGMLSEERFETLLRQYGPWGLEIMLCNYGEPLMNPLTPRFVRIARAYLMRTGLSTNMTVRRFDAVAYAESGLDFMTLSLDGATQAVYEKYRRKGDLETAFRNIRALIAARREAGRRTPIVSWQFLAFEHNAHEIDAAINIARELGVDQFIVANPFDVSWDQPEIRPANIEPRMVQFTGASDDRLAENWIPNPSELRDREITAAFESPFLSEMAEQLDADAVRTAHSCQWLYRNLVMDANGRVIPCCAAPKAGFELVFDRVTEQSGNPFNSPRYQMARSHFGDGRLIVDENVGAATLPYCVRCEWNQDTAHTDGAQVEQYFRTIPGAPVSAAAISALANW